jgi:hypothetical protein
MRAEASTGDVGAESLPSRDPDMTVMPASPPADTAIDSIAIAILLQAKAMAQLNRGHNITNWLEQTGFMTMDKNGVIVPEYITAMHLGQ